MDPQSIVQKTKEHVRRLMEGEGSGHDWWHVERVWKCALRLATEESADGFTVQLAALLHDIADWKFHDGDTSVGPRVAREWLESMKVEPSLIEHVCQIIENLSFKGAGVETPMKTIEGKIVQDADRLDGIGAIGVGRTFAYGGYRKREMHNPEIPPEPHDSFEAYKNSEGPTVNHFYEKLLLLRDRMNTESARRIAIGRHRYMEEFLERFFLEWEGEA